MKKFITIMLLALIFIPFEANSKKMYGVYYMTLQSTNYSTEEAELTDWGDGSFCFKLNSNNRFLNYKRYNYNTIHGKNIPTGWKAYRYSKSNGYHGITLTENDDYYLLIKNDGKCVREFHYYNYGNWGGGWKLQWFCEYSEYPGPHHPAYNPVPDSSPTPSPGYVPTPSPSPNYNSTTPSQGRTCAGCHGTGVCTMCQGKGGYYTNSGTYTGSGSKTWHQCSSCHGSGKCGVSYGKGTIR